MTIVLPSLTSVVTALANRGLDGRGLMCCPAYLTLSLPWLMESCRVRGVLRVASCARARGLQQKPALTPWGKGKARARARIKARGRHFFILSLSNDTI
jgi:hypothetical protein